MSVSGWIVEFEGGSGCSNWGQAYLQKTKMPGQKALPIFSPPEAVTLDRGIPLRSR